MAWLGRDVTVDQNSSKQLIEHVQNRVTGGQEKGVGENHVGILISLTEKNLKPKEKNYFNSILSILDKTVAAENIKNNFM